MADLTSNIARYFKSPQTATIIEPIFVEDAYGVKTYNGMVSVSFHNPEIPSPMKVMFPSGGGQNDYSGGPPTSGTIVLVSWAQGNMPVVTNTYQIPCVGKSGLGVTPTEPGEKVMRACKQTVGDDGKPSTSPVSTVHMNDYGTIHMKSMAHNAYINVGKDIGGSTSIDTGNQLAIKLAAPSSGIGLDDSGGVLTAGSRIASYCNNLIWRVQTLASLIVSALTVVVRGNATITVGGNVSLTSYGEITVNAEGNVSINSDAEVRLQGSEADVLCARQGQYCSMGGDLYSLRADDVKAKPKL